MFGDSWPSARKWKNTLMPTSHAHAPNPSTTTAHEYPPRSGQDAQRRQVERVSPPSSDVDDEVVLVLPEHHQVDDGDDYPRGVPFRAPSVAVREERDHVHQQFEASATARHKPERAREGLTPPPLQSQDESDRLRQQIEASLATQRRSKSGREQMTEPRPNVHLDQEREKDQPPIGSRRGWEREAEREASVTVDFAVIDTLKEENEKLKSMLRQQIQQLDATQERTKQELSQMQSEAEELKHELNTSREAHKQEVERLKVGLQEHGQRVEHLTADRERVRRDVESISGNLNAEIERLKLKHTKEMERSNAGREKVKQEQSKTQYEVEELRGELSAAREAHREEVKRMEISLQEHVQLVKDLSDDREHERRDGEAVKGNFNAEIEQLKLVHAEETEQLKKALAEANRDRTQVHLELGEVRQSLDVYALKLDESLRERDVLRRELSNVKNSSQMAAEFKRRLDIQSRELHSAQEESSELKRELNHLLTNLEEQVSDPKGVRSFPRRADTLSGTEVTNIIQRVNAEVLQSTAFMADSMVGLFFDYTTTQVAITDEQLSARKRASGTIGDALVHFLGTKKHEDDPILIQIAFQACLTYHLHRITSAWIVGGDENHNRLIDEIYQDMHEKETQVVAGRWRALTRAHVPSAPFDNSQTASDITNWVILSLSDILLVAGCNVPKSDVTSALSSRFSDKLSFLISLAMRANKIVVEDITSCDFEVTAVQPATAFAATEMEDSYNSGRSARTRGRNIPKVLCATDLGLRKRTRLGMTGEGQWETKVLLKPKVALESIVE